MNPGRGATRLRHDDIPVWVDVPRWLVPKMRDAFAAAGIAYVVREAYIRSARGPDHVLDRFAFPEVASDLTRGPARARGAAAVQRVVDSVPDARRRGC